MILPTLNFPILKIESNNFFGIPEVLNQDFFIDTNNLKPFNFLLSSKRKINCHFFLHDYQFERIWLNPPRYAKILKKCDFVCSADFSLYTDMPYVLQIFNTYRSRTLQRYWQDLGINVLTTVSWSDKKSFDFCFLGIPLHSNVIISSMTNNEFLFMLGLNEMVKRIKPNIIYCYGKEFENDYNIIFLKPYFEDIVNGRKRKQQQR